MIVPLLAVLSAVSAFVAGEPDEYDYVIVGSGPGGGSLAGNLATVGYSVFLIEAGGDESQSDLQRVPALSVAASDSALHSWHFFVEHYGNKTQARRDLKYTYTLPNGSYHVGPDPPADAEPAGIYYPRGATLGGSAQVNAMNFAWAPDNEWDYIANLTGDASWAHEEMRRHLMALENCSYVPHGTPGHGLEGYIESSHVDPATAIAEPNVARLVRQVFEESGDLVPEDDEHMAELLDRDINRVDTDRYANPLTFVLPRAVSATTGARSGVAEYIHEVVDAGHPLTVSLRSLGTRVLLEEDNMKPKAVGVEYMVGEALYSADERYDAAQEGEIRSVRARKEVIVAGGTFNTPQLLKLSGIGPRDELESLDIPVIVDLLAVGNFMQDNYESALQVRADLPWVDLSNSPCSGTFDSSDPCFVEWQTNGTGPYIGTGAGFFLTWRSSVSWDDDADLFFLSQASIDGTGFYPGYSERPAAPHYWTTSIVKMQTANPSGTVKLRSKDPREAPDINFNYFAESAERDLQAIVDGVELLLGAYDAINTSYTIIEPDPRIDMRQAIMDQTFSHHATSSCRMGPAGHRDYCVDSRFRVNGVDNLRVVDASVLPRVPGAMPNAPTFTISRKAFETFVEDERRGYHKGGQKTSFPWDR